MANEKEVLGNVACHYCGGTANIHREKKGGALYGRCMNPDCRALIHARGKAGQAWFQRHMQPVSPGVDAVPESETGEYVPGRYREKKPEADPVNPGSADDKPGDDEDEGFENMGLVAGLAMAAVGLFFMRGSG